MGPLDYVRAACVVHPTTHDWPFMRAKPPHPHLAWLGLLLGLRDLAIREASRKAQILVRGGRLRPARGRPLTYNEALSEAKTNYQLTQALVW